MTSAYLIDTSALANHYLGDAGDRFVADCIRKGADVCAITLFEFGIFLRRNGISDTEASRTWSLYRQTIGHVRTVDEAVTERALSLRLHASGRLPLADACIAACAAHHNLMLVHADAHYATLPSSVKAIDIRTL